MSPLTSSLLTALIVVGGRWSQKKTVNMQVAIGMTGVAVSLALLTEANEKFARQFGMLIVAGAVFMYGQSILTGLGFRGGQLEKVKGGVK